MNTSENFKRPKVWSSTRMVVYEWDMIKSFLENVVYFNHPSKYLLLAQVHGLVMFSLKIILKNVQRTDLRYFYVKSVIVENVSFPEFKLIYFYLMIDFFLFISFFNFYICLLTY